MEGPVQTLGHILEGGLIETEYFNDVFFGHVIDNHASKLWR
jgi:hypothetical protein